MKIKINISNSNMLMKISSCIKVKLNENNGELYDGGRIIAGRLTAV